MLAAEQARSEPRVTLVSWLEKAEEEPSMSDTPDPLDPEPVEPEPEPEEPAR